MYRLLLVICLCPLIASVVCADTITLVSGNADKGQNDPLITVRGAEITVRDVTAYSSGDPS